MTGTDTSAATRERLAKLIEPVAVAAGFELDELVLSQAGRRMVLRVIIDGDAGVSLDDAAMVAREISTVLDTSEGDTAMGETPYTLEVTSPGVDRPLTQPRHWRRNQERLVRARTQSGELLGRIKHATSTSVTLLVDGEELQFAYDELISGTVQLEFRPRSAEQPEEKE